MGTTDERIDRLPKWAQDRIATLTKNVDYWKEKATAGETGQTNTRVNVSSGEWRYLPSYRPVEFHAAGTVVQVYVAPGGGSGYDGEDHVVVRIQPDSPNGGRMSIIPAGANSIVVKAAD